MYLTFHLIAFYFLNLHVQIYNQKLEIEYLVCNTDGAIFY